MLEGKPDHSLDLRLSYVLLGDDGKPLKPNRLTQVEPSLMYNRTVVTYNNIGDVSNGNYLGHVSYTKLL